MEQKSDVIALISSHMNTFSTSEQKIASYILQNPTDISDLSVRELASATQTSPATVSRFARTLGYRSFSDFRLAVAITMGAIDPIGYGADKVNIDDIPASLGFILDNKIAELTETARLIKPYELERSVNLMRQANEVLICGVGNTITTAMNAAFKFNQAGIRAHAPVSVESAISSSINLNASDVVLLLSTSSSSKRLSIIADNAEDSGTPMILVTDNDKAPLADRAAYVIRAVSHDAIFGANVRFSQNSLNFVVEIFYLLLLTGWTDTIERNKILLKNLGGDMQ